MDNPSRNTRPSIPFFSAYAKMWICYAVFKGRATRSEFWKATAIHIFILLALCCAPMFSMIFEGSRRGSDTETEVVVFALGVIYLCVSFLPRLGLMVRRLHDVGCSGWVLLPLNLVSFAFSCVFPLIPSLVVTFLLYLYLCTDSDHGTNIYGDSAKYPCP